MELLNLHLVAIVFGVFVLIVALMNKWSSSYTRKRHSEHAKKIYACGEDISPSHMDIPQESFYAVFIKIFKLEKLKNMHTGELTRYILWVFAGMIIIMFYLLMLWRMGALA